MAKLKDELISALPGLNKAVFSQPVDKSGPKKVSIRPVIVKGQTIYQAESFVDNKAFHRNLREPELLNFVEEELEGRFRQVLIMSSQGGAQYVLRSKGGYKKSGTAAPLPMPGGAQAHDRAKERILAEGEQIPALVDLGVFTEDYRIVKSKYDKYRQIDRFISLVDQELKDYQGEEISILDFGCGKSYLTFILYYYFAVKRGMNTRIVGYDLKADVVEKCQQIARRYGYDGLSFRCADVGKDVLSQEKIDMVVTLHACDTATDFALDYALRRGVKYIFSVPCCQHEIDQSISKGGDFDLLLEHGLIKERFSALLTDSIRAAVLKARGYQVELIEFIDFEHSPKNLMIRAVYTGRCREKELLRAKALQERYKFKQKLLELQD